jgi:hypothetical protein
VRKQKKYQIFVLFLEVVTLTVGYFLTRTRFLTKFGTKIDSYKMDVYGTSEISNLAVIFKMATKMPKN